VSSGVGPVVLLVILCLLSIEAAHDSLAETVSATDVPRVPLGRSPSRRSGMEAQLQQEGDELDGLLAGLNRHATPAAAAKVASVRPARTHRSRLGSTQTTAVSSKRVLDAEGPLTATGHTKLADYKPIVPEQFESTAAPNASLVSNLVPEAQEAYEAAEKQEEAGDEREKKARVIGNALMRVLQARELKEAPEVADFQKAARAARDDFGDAVKANGNTATLIAQLQNNTVMADSAYNLSQISTWDALEDYDISEKKTREVSWSGWIAKDRMGHKFQRAKDNKKIEDYIGFYCSSELKVALTHMNTLAATSNNKIQLALDAKKAAEDADEDNNMMMEMKEAQTRLQAAREKQQQHEAKQAQERAEKEAEAAAKQQEQVTADLEATNSSLSELSEDEIREQEQRKLSEVLEASEMAKFAAKAAAVQAEKNRKQAEEAEAAVERMDKAIEKKGKLKMKAAAALEAENRARDAQVKLSRAADKAYRHAKASAALAHQLKMRADGEYYIGKQAAIGTVKIDMWAKETIRDVETQMRESDRVKGVVEEVRPQYERAVALEEQARRALQVQEENVKASEEAKRLSAHALAVAKLARRQAWRSAYKSRSSNRGLLKTKSELERQALELLDDAGRKKTEAQRIEDSMVAERNSKQADANEADSLYNSAMLSNDYDAKVSAERAQLNAQSALNAAQSALKAAMVIVTGMRTQAATLMDKAAKMNQAAAKMGNSDNEETESLKRANNANNFMRGAAMADVQALRFVDESKENLKREQKTYAKYKQIRIEKQKELDDAIRDVERKVRYEARANVSRAEWTSKVGEADEYARKGTSAGDRYKAQWATQVKLAQNASAEMQEKADIASEALQEIDDQYDSIKEICKEAGTESLYKLANMQKKWALIYLEEAKLVAGQWEVTLKATEEPIKNATLALEEVDKQNKALIDAEDWKQTRAEQKQASNKVKHATNILLEEKRRKERLYAHQQFKLYSEQAEVLQETEDKAEEKRRVMTLQALELRVRSAWQKRAAIEISPRYARRTEKSLFRRIVAMWDRDGTPMGPGKLDNWLQASVGRIVQQFETKPRYTNQMGHEVITAEPGYLNPDILSRCSAACEPYAELECSTGTVGEACTRGQVMRARYKYGDTFSKAEADWFVCRCNGGVMQLASSESISVVHSKDKLMQLDYAPTDMDFDTRMHTHELVPDKWFTCFGHFRHWLNHQTNFSLHRQSEGREVDQHVIRHSFLNWTGAEEPPSALEEPFVTLDRLAFSSDSESIFLEVRKYWQRECVGMDNSASWVGRSTLEETPSGEPGATDSAIDFYHLRSSNATSLSPHDWPTAATRFHELAARYADSSSKGELDMEGIDPIDAALDAKHQPAVKAPAEEAPTEETPAEEAPAEEAPAEEGTNEPTDEPETGPESPSLLSKLVDAVSSTFYTT